MTNEDSYVLPGTSVLRNKLGLTEPAALNQIERKLVIQRIAEGSPAGDFTLSHLRAIHRHLFQDLYAWAGELRTVEIAKDGHQFQFRQFIEIGMADIHRRLRQSNFLRGLSDSAFAKATGAIMGDLNYAHPFREGNGRSQLQYLEQLAAQAGHPLDVGKIEPTPWLEASRASHDGNHELMASVIAQALVR